MDGVLNRSVSTTNRRNAYSVMRKLTDGWAETFTSCIKLATWRVMDGDDAF
jgi:hypothetical protein